MKFSYKKILSFFIASIFVLGVVHTNLVLAQDTEYVPLQNIPGVTDDTGKITFASYLQGLFFLAIAIAGILAVVMIMYGGVKYMSVESWSGKGDAKDIIVRALLGLLLAFTSWIILYTINPDILNISLDPSTIDTEVDYIPDVGDPDGELPILDAGSRLREDVLDKLGSRGVSDFEDKDGWFLGGLGNVEDWDTENEGLTFEYPSDVLDEDGLIDELEEICKKWGFKYTGTATGISKPVFGSLRTDIPLFRCSRKESEYTDEETFYKIKGTLDILLNENQARFQEPPIVLVDLQPGGLNEPFVSVIVKESGIWTQGDEHLAREYCATAGFNSIEDAGSACDNVANCQEGFKDKAVVRCKVK